MTSMLPTLGLLLGCQLFGEVAARGVGLPVPGPVLGLALLVLILWMRPAVTETLRPTIAVILANLSLMFVPAGVGVIGNLEVLSEDWFALLVILVVSTVLAMLAAVATFIGVRRLTGGPAE
jgi:holin-like protein